MPINTIYYIKKKANQTQREAQVRDLKQIKWFTNLRIYNFKISYSKIVNEWLSTKRINS